jgi:hypothetical protein
MDCEEVRSGFQPLPFFRICHLPVQFASQKATKGSKMGFGVPEISCGTKERSKSDGVIEIKTGFYLIYFQTGLNQCRIPDRYCSNVVPLGAFKILYQLSFTFHVVSIGEGDRSHSIEKFLSQYRSQIVQSCQSTKLWECNIGAGSEKLALVLPEGQSQSHKFECDRLPRVSIMVGQSSF